MFLALIIFSIKLKNHTIKTKKIEFSLAGQKITYEIARDFSNLEIAYHIYIELITRKAALPFDEENDIILEVYNSWYQLFGIIRNEIKSVNGSVLLNKNRTLPLIEITTKILNDGLRPHLTKYQGRFRNWLDKHPDPDITPQELQRLYPEYTTLITDLKNVNIALVNYSKELHAFIYQN